jgi:hypothetical protein
MVRLGEIKISKKDVKERRERNGKEKRNISFA